ncbi:kinetochore scaffold 1 isoform X1 [Saccopteryx bilineata]|uniref:kinetochore scaffold 1 isoform X1 n=2 Tax=Saccopteryx bilineata TaxID=59482 RepID=UPI00338EB17F
MDGMSSETNETRPTDPLLEPATLDPSCDNIERPVRRRQSSILKPPRSPLRDLRDGNEIVPEPSVLRNKKSSRRVSFADTIKVFQTEPHMKIVRKSEIAETEGKENVLIQSKNLEDNYCEITGMNTLLCAPIQTQMQQREISITEYSHEKKHSNNQTVIFSDENQIDLTASHTVTITKGLLDYSKSEKSAKIDTTSFLADLKLHTEDSEMKKNFNFSMDQTTNSEKKINFSDFIKRLKTGKSNASSTGPDKENSEIFIHSKDSNKDSFIHQMYESHNVDENSSNVTRIFRERDDWMNFTQCYTANIQSLVPTSSEASLRECKSDDNTIYGSDLMDLTINHTIQILPSGNLSEIENHAQTIMMDVTTGYRTKAPVKKSVFENKPNAGFQDPSLNPKGEIHITESHNTGTETHMVTQTSNQDVRTLAMIPESICSSPTIQDYKTFLYSSCNDAMELTKCLSNMREEKNLLKHDNNYAKMYPNPYASSLPTEKTIYSEDSMDITKSHTVALGNQIFKQDQPNIQLTDIPISEKEMMLQNHIAVSKDEEMNVNYSSVLHVSKEELQQSLTNPLPISVTGKNTVIFTGDDKDLTESHTTHLESQAPLASYNPATENASKSHSYSRSLLDEWEKVAKSHTELFQQPNIISKNTLTETWGKEKDQVLKLSPCLDKVSPQSADINQDKATSSNIQLSGGDLSKQIALGNNRNAVSCEQSLFPTTKLFSSEGQSAMENHNAAVNSHLVKSVPGQNSKLPEPLRKSLDNPTLDSSRDKIINCSEEEQNMDLTKSHTVVIGFGPSEVQELDETNLENTNSLTTIHKQVAVKVEKCNETPIGKTGVVIFNDTDVLEDRSVQEPGLLNEKQDVRICGRKSIDRLKNDRTVIFSEGDENDITKSYTLEINHRPLLDEYGFHLMPLEGTSKTILYTCGQDDMQVTRSHTTAIECEIVSPDEVTTRPVDKTVMFIDNHDELEITKSHTVFIDYPAKDRTVLPDRPDFELSKRKSIGKPKVTSAEESVFFPENDESNHLTAKVSQLIVREWANSGPIEKDVAFRADDNMEVSTSTIWRNDKDVPKPGFLNEPLPGKSQRWKSLRLKSDNSVAFSSNDKNDKDIIQSCTLEINNKNTLEVGEDSLLVPLTGTPKTVLYTCGQDDMEITRSHTTALECKAVTPVKITTRPVDNTVMFVGNHSDLEVTKSHTAFIDCQDTEKILQECPTFEMAKGKTSDVSFHKDGSSVQKITKIQAQAVENKASHCPVQNHPAYTNDLASEYYLKPEGLSLSAPYSLLEKEEVIQTNAKRQLGCGITVLKDQDLIKEPKNQTLVSDQDLENMTKLDSKQVFFKLLEDQMEAFVHNAAHSLEQTFADDVCVGSQTHFSTQLPLLPQQGQSIVNNDETIMSKAGSKNLNIVIRNSSVLTCESESKMLTNEEEFTLACGKKVKKNIQTTKCNMAIEIHSNSDLTKQVIQTHANTKEASDLVIASNPANFCSINKNLNNLNGKTEKFLDFQTVHKPSFPKQLLELVNKTDNDMSIVHATEIDINTVSNTVEDVRDEENKFFHNGAETNSVSLMTTVKDKARRGSLGIFLPRLPNKRNCSITGTNDLEQIPSDTTDLNHLEMQLVSSKDSDIGFIAAKLNLSPSQYINEENLPIYPGEINSSDSISIETEEKALIETYQKEISSSENKMKEIYNSQKRTWVPEEDDDIQDEKKIRKSKIKCSDATQDQEIIDHHAEGDIDKNANSVLIKSLSRTPSSFSSSLDSVKADGTSLDFSTYRNSQMESQFLTDAVCEESLKEKLKDGRITIKEFFILLQVHILIQKPRQSTLSAKFTINTQPTSEDLLLSQYVYRPKIQIYREDCELLRKKIEELKLSALNQDKLLADVNRNLWEKMRHYSDEELKAFGIYLNKIKSHFTKMTKVFTHQGKVALYRKLVQSAQNEREKLQLKINEVDNILQKIANCLTEVEIETKNLEDEKKDISMEEWDSEMRAAEKELEQLKTEEEELQRNLLELEVQKQQTLAQIDFVQKQMNTTEELLDQLSLSEWDVIEWSDDQAVVTFLYDTIELTITFGEPVVGLPFLNEACRRIVDLNFQSLLDEDKAPPSSILVHKLIFQYINEQESWKKKCTTQHQVSKMLQEISLVIRHCRLLGEEIEFLKRWGPNYNLMNIDVNNTELRLLFSSYAAFAKFEITLSLSAHYPTVLLPFSVKNHLGNMSHNEISALLSKVPLEDNYLKNVVKQIYQDLHQGCDFHQYTHGPQL